MEPRTQADVLLRLRCVEGHLRGIVDMTEQGRPCASVVHQIQAVRGALQQINTLLLTSHLDVCLRRTCAELPEADFEQLRKELFPLLVQKKY